MKNSNLLLELRSYSSETRSHHHDYHQLVLPVDGELSISVDGKEGAVFSEQLAVVAAGKDHGFSSSNQNVFVVADIPEALAPNLEKLPAFITLDPILSQYVSFLHQHIKSDAFGKNSERQMLLLLIQLLQERFGKELRLDRRIESARAYLDQHFKETISLPQLASIANLSPRQLSKLFLHELGMTPSQYVIEKRMQKAWHLLECSTLNVQQVAEHVGYSNLSSFSDRFRKHFNKPPSYFRKIGK
ncbi:AraC family transcriptional regulator [Pseudoteredinibacter isoporae]|uniref:AraC-like DNA-binding protein n=1 Tax=Pseudoteredinibacter isoporae TaxID=570281 RepID=A0A7X0JRD1_9GAMM|nr:AraC family transcriptional regulator [Pseudoteredinibacter isoporae]MBB6520238.1 AraC-like DNA-binding protein [Pseudoteredinibacter isoporae]NHO85810.1 helix-turn-helix transcriptional regulator [Pseudoteredinibacter isoporae]NIB25738.1 helix-turn-helix transcriptional regulator [Pseudoteredinibacter isoporae]